MGNKKKSCYLSRDDDRANGPYGGTIPLAHWRFDGDTIFPLPSAQPDMHGWKNLLEAAAWEIAVPSRSVWPCAHVRRICMCGCGEAFHERWEGFSGIALQTRSEALTNVFVADGNGYKVTPSTLCHAGIRELQAWKLPVALDLDRRGTGKLHENRVDVACQSSSLPVVSPCSPCGL